MHKYYPTLLTIALVLTPTIAGALTYSNLVTRRKAQSPYILAPPPLAGNPIFACYPSTFAAPNSVRYVEAADGVRYTEVVANYRGDSATRPKNLYLRTSKDGCKWLNRKPVDWDSGRLKFIPKSEAVALAKQTYDPELKGCIRSMGKEKSGDCIAYMEKAINQPPVWTSSNINYLFPDDATALNELGVNTDRVLVVESIAQLQKLKKQEEEKDRANARTARRNSKKVSKILPARRGKPILAPPP